MTDKELDKQLKEALFSNKRYMIIFLSWLSETWIYKYLWRWLWPYTSRIHLFKDGK